MLNYATQKQAIKLNITLKEVFLLHRLTIINHPIKIKDIANLNPLLDVKERQLISILNDLENKNLLVKHRFKNGFLFNFPYVNAKNILKTFKPSKLKICKNIQVLFDKNCKNIHHTNKINILYIKNLKNNHKDNFKNNQLINPLYNIKSLKEKFKTLFPVRNNYLETPLPLNFNQSIFFDKIKNSSFLMTKDYLSLSWMIKKYDAIINDYYSDFIKNPKQQTIDNLSHSAEFTQRTYDKEFLNSLFDTL